MRAPKIEAPDPVAAALREAADTLRRLPPAVRRPRLTSWPDLVRDSAASLAAGAEGRRPRPAAPTPGAIDRMDRALGWLLACDAEARRLVWARACGVPWRRLVELDGRSHVTLRRVVARGHDQIRRAAGDSEKSSQQDFSSLRGLQDRL